MRINWLITGGAGYIGSHVVANIKLKYPSDQVVVLDNLSSGFRKFLSKEITLFEGDICNEGDVSGAFESFVNQEFDINVIHLAGKKSPTESESQPFIYWQNNVQGSLILAKYSMRYPVKNFLFSSSCSVYGDVEGPVAESHPINPVSIYGKTKAVAEQIFIDAFRSSKINLGILRYFNVVGTGYLNIFDRSSTNLFPNILNSLILKTKFHLTGFDYPTHDGTCIRDYVHVLDIAEAHVRGLNWLNKNNGNFTLNVGTGAGNSVLEIVETFNKFIPDDLTIEFVDRRPGDPAMVLADNSLMSRLFNWKPNLNLDDMVKSILWQARGDLNV
jgi:UDP-glucose 4-epimerase